MSNSSTLRYGSKGSLVINIQGPKAGLWHDFSSDEGGNIFSLIMRETNCSFKEAADHLKGKLGISNETNLAPIKREKPQFNETADKIQKLATVQSLFEKSGNIEGTTADTYLKKTRKITCKLSQDLKFLPKGTTFQYKGEQKTLKHDTLATFARDKDNILHSVQLTRLNDNASRAKALDGTNIPKTKYGIGKDGFVTLNHSPSSNTVIIAEGVETALSIKETGVNATIVASQGIHNIKNYQGPEAKIIIAADNDDHKPESGTHKVIDKAEQLFKAQSKDVSIIKPYTPGQDFNDVLKEKGVEGIRCCIKFSEVSSDNEIIKEHGR